MSQQKIVIVGAGPAGISAAFYLTDPQTNPNWRERYTVDVYQMGWRAGGKGATGRNPDAGERIQEHGIHVFGNMYFNSLRMMDACYREVQWDEHDRHRTMEEAFLPSLITYMTDYVDGKWYGELANFPGNDEVPWKGAVWPDARGIVMEVLSLASRKLAEALEGREHEHGSWWERVKDKIEHWIGEGVTAIAEKLAEQTEQEMRDPHVPDPARHSLALKVLDAVDALLHGMWELDPANGAKRLRYINVDLAIATLRGMIADDVIRNGIDALDGENYRDWLARHGASETTLASSVPQAYPNTALSYEFGDSTAIPAMSAAAYASFFIRQLMGKGAGAYFFAEGTGETIMKPLFRLLEQRGVRMHFFHKLAALHPDSQRPVIESLDFEVQATVRGDRYEPLRRLADGELVWPDRPNYEQLEEGEALRAGGHDLESWWTAWPPVGKKTLRRGVDFDQVVLATPVGTLPYVAAELIAHPAAKAKWQPMVENIKTAASQNVQIWLKKNPAELGWNAQKGKTDRYVGPLYNQDLTSFCDFTDLVAEERWPAGNRPQGLIYFIGALGDPDEIPPFTDHGYPERMRQRVQWATAQFLRNIDGLLPGAPSSPIDKRSFDFDLLVMPQGEPSRGLNRILGQWVKANIDPNERYTLTVKGTVQYRLESWDSCFDNLVLAGDWIFTGFNVGSFEGAVMGGKLASLALTGAPGVDGIYGYTFLHPGRKGPDKPRI